MLTPALDTQYSPRLVLLTSAEQEEILMIVPLLAKSFSCFSISFTTAWVKNILPLVLMPMTLSKLSSLISKRSALFSGATPALFTSTSILPKASIVSLTILILSSLTPIFPWIYIQSIPSFVRISKLALFFSLSPVATRATLKPSLPKRFAMANPIPLLAPVTRAVFLTIESPPEV